MANNTAKTQQKNRLAINCIAGTAFMMLSAFKAFKHEGFEAQFKAAVSGIAVITRQLCPGDPDATEEVMQRLMEAINPSKPLIVSPSALPATKNSD